MENKKIFTVENVTLNIEKKQPPILVITAEGTTRTSPWKSGRLVPSKGRDQKDGIFDFDFVADDSDAMQQAIGNIEASGSWENFPINFRGVRIHSETNMKEVLLSNSSTHEELLSSKNQFIGISTNFSFEEAFKDAIAKDPKDVPSDYFRYVVTEIGYEEGGFAEVTNLFVKIKRTNPS